MTSTIAVGIVEDEPNAREGVSLLIDGAPGFRVVGRYASMEEAEAGVPVTKPDVLLVDLGLPGRSGIDGISAFRESMPSLQLLVLTVFADPDHVFRALCAGAHGYLLKDTPPDRLLDAIRDVHVGGSPMSPAIARRVLETFRATPPPAVEAPALSGREREVLGFLAEGYSYHAAGEQLGISIDTIRAHVRNIYEKLHVHTRAEAVLKAMRSGLLK